MAGVGSRHRLEALRIDRSRTVARKTKKRIVAAAVVGLLALLAVIALLQRPPQVAIGEVREARPGEAATELTAAGYVSSERRSTVAPKIPGRLVQVAVKEGQHVDEGDVLARLDDADAVVELRQAEAQARAAEGELASARAARGKADRDLDQMTRLEASGAVSPTALLDTRSAANEARAGEQNFQTFSEVRFRFVPTPGILASAVLFGIVMGAVGGLFPALRAARAPVLEAMRR